MQVLKIIFGILFILLLVALLLGWHLGLFQKFEVEEKLEGGFKVAGKEIIGPYSAAGKGIEEVENKLKEKGIAPGKGFGIYYDDPKVVPAEKCRSFVGNILEEKDSQKILEIQSTGLKIDSIPKAKSLVVEFPLKNNMSFMIGPMKAYPALSKYMQEKGYKTNLSYEIYDIPNKKILYFMQYE